MMNRTSIAFAALAVLILKSSPAEAHGGGLDADGCHTNHKTGDHHCHGGGRNQGSYRQNYRAPQAPNTDMGHSPEVNSKTSVDFTCVGAPFQDPTDSSYVYCPVSGGYGIIKGGSKTGFAAEGSAAFAAIKAASPSPSTTVATPVSSTTVATPVSSEQPSIYGYVFRAFLGVISMLYIGFTILSKDVREIGGGWHLILGSAAVWSILCAVGVISISGFLCPFIALALALFVLASIFG
jgi:hypothetical protein